MNAHLRVAPELTLPLEAVTETFAMLAKRGAGKSNAAVVMAEQMHDAGLPWVAVDPKGDWWGIRSSRDGKGPGLPVLVLGGRHGDVPLEPTAGALIADLVAEQRITCIVDVSLMSKTDMRRFLADFAERLYTANTDPLHVFAEEAHEYIPQRVDAGAARMVGAWEKLVKWGRTHGLGVTLITQRSASLNKDVLTQVETLIALRTTGPQDQAQIRAWVDEHDTGAAMMAQLRKLANGEAFVLSPQWLELEEPLRIRFHQRRTFDSGATPRAGEKRITPRSFAEVDLAALKEAMAETIERAQADDPKRLRARIRELEQQLAAEQAKPAPEPAVEYIEVPVLAAEVVADLVSAATPMADLLHGILTELQHASSIDSHKAGNEGRPTTRSSAPRATSPSSVPGSAPGAGSAALRGKNSPAARETRPAAAGVPAGEQVTPARRRLLDALLSLEAIGVDAAPKNQLALFAGVSPKSSGFANNLGALRTAGLIDYPASGRVQITDEGRAHTDEVLVPASTEELHERVRQLVSPARWRIVEPLLEVYPQAMDKTDLAEDAGVSAKSSGFANNLGALRSLGLIDYPGPGLVVAADLLFLDGGR